MSLHHHGLYMRATGQTTPTLIQSTTTSTLLEGSIPNRSEGDNCTHNDISCYYCDRCMWDHLYQMTIVGKHKHTCHIRCMVGWEWWWWMARFRWIMARNQINGRTTAAAATITTIPRYGYNYGYGYSCY